MRMRMRWRLRWTRHWEIREAGTGCVKLAVGNERPVLPVCRMLNNCACMRNLLAFTLVLRTHQQRAEDQADLKPHAIRQNANPRLANHTELDWSTLGSHTQRQIACVRPTTPMPQLAATSETLAAHRPQFVPFASGLVAASVTSAVR